MYNVWISYYLYDLLLYDLLIHPLSFNQVMLHQSSAHAIHGWLTLTLRLKLTCRSVSQCDKNVPEKALHHAAKRCVRAASFTTGGLVWTRKKVQPGPGWALKVGCYESKIFVWSDNLRLMEEILHHLGCIKPCEYWDIYRIDWCRISSINSITRWPLNDKPFLQHGGAKFKHAMILLIDTVDGSEIRRLPPNILKPYK